MARLVVLTIIVLASQWLGTLADDSPGVPSLRGGATANGDTANEAEGLPALPPQVEQADEVADVDTHVGAENTARAAGTSAGLAAEAQAGGLVAEEQQQATEVGGDGVVPAQTELEANKDLTVEAEGSGSAAGSAGSGTEANEAADASQDKAGLGSLSETPQNPAPSASDGALAAELAEAKASLLTVQQQLEQSEEQVRYHRQKAADNLAAATSSEAARSHAESLLAEKNAAFAEKEQACAEMEADLRKQFMESHRLLSEETARFAELYASVKGMETKLEEALQEVASKTASDAALQAKLDRAEASLASLRHEHQDLEALYADPSLQHFLQTTAHKVARHPGIEGATNKTFKYVLPKLRAGELLGRQWLNSTHSTVFQQLHNERFMALLGHEKAEPWLPLLTGVLVYGLVIMPCCCTMCCLTRVVCRPKLILTFCHLYFTISCLCASGFAAIMGTDPLAAFAARDSELYLFVQVAFAIVLIVYASFILLLRCFVSHEAVRGYRTFQLLVVSAVATAYYALVWTPAMVDTSPQLDDTVAELAKPWLSPQWATMLHWLPYLLLTCLFAILLRLEQYCWKDRSTTLSVDVTDLDQVRALLRECKDRGGEMLTELATLVENPDACKGD
mmetsp:Transcript_47103/g.86387  ORF Transcript_47103/g.86387 Transcript_47103/m.86387 type:complete len:624 (-) Transcript_47103:55-1926(-)